MVRSRSRSRREELGLSKLALLVTIVVALFAETSLATTERAEESLTLRGSIVDADSGAALPARLYIRSGGGKLFLARSADEKKGSAVPYERSRSATSIEVHTALSAHDFVADLPPGTYTLTAERGKEYLPATATVVLPAPSGERTPKVVLRLRRWIDLRALGWYSGETHVHRSLDELPTAMLADDLNVALPLTYWVTKSHTPPSAGDKNSGAATAELIRVDREHVIYPLNTEYEIFTVRGRRHTLGAVFALRHRTVLTEGVPPVRAIAERVHREGGLLELDKHNWPWSMMLIPVMGVDLYELTNNHVWRTEFHFKGFGVAAADYMKVERGPHDWTERGWIDFTLKNYYALLDCGFRLRPTAGTASGVHPVPLGYGRVYVYLPGEFSFDAWMDGLDAGRSFVTTGPLLDVQIDRERPGATLRGVRPRQITGWAKSASPLSRIEIVSARGGILKVTPANRKTTNGSYESRIDLVVAPRESTWYAVRCFEPQPGGRERFAHSAPFHVEIEGKPLRPRPEVAAYLVERVRAEIERNKNVLDDAALAEYRSALEAYEAIAKTAR